MTGGSARTRVKIISLNQPKGAVYGKGVHDQQEREWWSGGG